MMKLGLLAVLASLALSASAATSDPFVGEWKLDPSRSTLKDTMVVEKLAANKYAFDFGGGPEAIVVDGTDQPSRLYGGSSLSVASEGGTWTVVRKNNGRKMLSATWSLSSDGATLTDRYTGYGADGSPYEQVYTYERKAGGPGFAGTWVSKTEEAVNFFLGLRIRPFEGGGLSIVDSSSQILGSMDFAAPLVRRVDERTLELMAKKRDGEHVPVLQLKLSADLKALTLSPRAAAGDEPRFLAFDRV
jgi:hypothetical protein